MLIDLIRADALAARKARDGIKVASLTSLIAEADRLGKDKGNRPPTDDEVRAIIRKFLKGIAETQAVAVSELLLADLAYEREWLETYLPKQVTGQELECVVQELVANLPDKAPSNLGQVMRLLRERLQGAFDGAEANQVIRSVLA